ncbi:MAG: helix-turn-helix domain-containing protein [Leptospirales bacterium]
MIETKYIRSLIYLNGKSITSIALEAGIDPTNLSRALKGHSTVSDEKMEKVLEHLGVDPVTGTLKPVVHRWKVNPAKFNLIEFEKLILDLVPGGGEIIILALKKDYYRWSTIVGDNGTRIIMDDAILTFVDIKQSEQNEEREEKGGEHIEKLFPEWKISYRNIPPNTLKKLIGNEILNPSEFDEILGLNYETPPLEGVSFALEEGKPYGLTWEAVVTKAKESGLTPREVAKKLGLSE